MNIRTKLLLTVGVVGALGVLLAFGTSAFFSSSASSGTNVAATGTMTMTGGTGVYFDTGAGADLMKPVASLAAGRTASVVASGSTTITNTGTLDTAFTLTQTAVGGTGLGSGTGLVGGNPALFSLAQLCITETAPVAGADCGVYNGDFDMAPASTAGTGDSVASTAISLGTFAASDSKTYRFDVWLPNSGVTDNTYQNQKATATFRFDGS